MFTAGEAGGEKNSPVALINWNYWQRRFDSDPAVVGRTFKLYGAAFTIIGITPRDFMGTNINVPDFWLPLHEQALLHPGSTMLENRENACCRLYGRLRAGKKLSEAQAEMNLLVKQQRSLHAPHSEGSKPKTVQLYSGPHSGAKPTPG